MSIRSEIRETLPDLFTAMGEDALLLPAAGGSIPCHVLIDFGVALEPDGFTLQIGQPATVIEALLSDLTGVEPSRDDRFALEGKTFTVQRVLASDGFTVRMAVK